MGYFQKSGLIVLCAALIWSLPAFGSNKGEVQLGFKAGGRLSTFTGADTRSLGGRRALSAGFFGNYALGPYVSIQVEVNYAAKGSKQELYVGNQVVPSLIKVDYIEVPVLMRLAYSRPGPVVPRIFLGPTVGFLMKKEATFEYRGEQIDAALADVRTPDFGLTFGLSLDISRPRGVVTIDARVTSALSTLHQEVPDFDRKNITFAFQVGYAIIR